MPDFLPGIRLNALFYEQVIEPLLGDVLHAAARIGWGSDVLGYDSERSTDHGWGPQLLVVASDDAVDRARQALDGAMPVEFRGWPVRYGWDATPITHHVVVTSLPSWSVDRLGLDATQGLDTWDWLVLPQQGLLEATAGAVYRDDTGELSKLRARLAWYPDDVWAWIIACQWRRVAQEEAFVGRAAEAGDELGSRVVAARLVRELMRLWLLLSRRYWPYSKWLGSAFRQLAGTDTVGAALCDVLAARGYAEREQALVLAYELTGAYHNEVGVTEPVEPTTRTYHGRPYRVIGADRFVNACAPRFSAALGALPLVGSVDQIADSTDLLSYPERTIVLRDFYGALGKQKT
ncbi:MAG: DUF4037 domain-containing protein [Acidimicrobiales bacterium]